MTPTVERRLAELATWLEGRRWLVLVACIAVVAGSAPLAARQFDRLSGGGWDAPGSESTRARHLLAAFPARAGEPLGLLIEGRTTADVDRTVAVAQRRLDRFDELHVGPPRRLEGGRAAFVPLLYAGPRDDRFDFATRLRETLVADAPAASTRVVGEAAMWSDFQQVSKKQLQRAELIGFPFILAVLLAAFGSLVATSVPLVLGAVALVVAGAGIFLLAGPFELSIYVSNMASMIGIGVSVDYSLFVVSRYRWALRSGRPPREALADALGSAGTAVVFSGATVVVSLSGLFLIDVGAIRSMAIGAILVVAVAVVATVTVVPVLLALAGPWVDRLRIGRRAGRARRRDLWGAWTYAVMARPGLALAAGVAALLLLTSPLLGIRTANGAFDQLPRDSEVRVAAERLAELVGPGVGSPLQAIAFDERVAARIAEEAVRLPAAAAVSPPVASADGSAYLVEVTPAAAPESREARRLLDDLRAVVPRDAGVVVGGPTAFSADQDEAIFGNLWKVVVFIVVMSYAVLLLLLRSVLLPLKAVLMNALSVGAAYGLLVLVFQEGWLDWTGYNSPGYVDTIVPVLLLGIVFGLSMDYEVFLLTRIRERYLATGDNARAVAEGLSASARTITAAALIMVAVFGSFAIAGATSIKQLGVGLAAAILIDATVIRLVIVPAAMRLLGDWNWWLPRAAARSQAPSLPAP